MPAPPKWSFAYYTRRQQMALWILLAGLVLIFGWSILPRKQTEPVPADEEFWLAVEALRTEETPAAESARRESTEYSRPQELFYFDPNTVDEESLIDLGLNSGQARSWIRYRNSGARFSSPEDLSRLYVLSQEDIAKLKPWVRIANRSTGQDFSRNASEENTRIDPINFTFDPNTVSADQLQQLGLNAGQARAWIRYRNSGARFDKAEDIARLRALDQEDIDRLQPLIRFESAVAIADASTNENTAPQTYSSTSSIGQSYESAVSINLDVNEASAEDWQRLRGIGPYWAGRIIRFRDALGGFVSIDQIGDTYGLPDSTFQAIRAQLTLNRPADQLSINTATEEELKRHPYINARQARALIAYREQHGYFSGPESLTDVRLLTADDRTR
ncbi:MAG: helix-hairpin-helix domain-containing protein, partial [Bacteroidota bacterium]